MTNLKFISNYPASTQPTALLCLLNDSANQLEYSVAIAECIKKATSIGGFFSKKEAVAFYQPSDEVELLLLMSAKSLDYEDVSGLINNAVKQVSSAEITNIAVDIRNLTLSSKQCKDLITAVSHSCYSYNKFKTTNKTKPIASVSIIADSKHKPDFDYANTLHKSLIVCKDLANAPANVATPTYIAQQASDFAGLHDSVDLEIIDESKFAEIGMNAFLFVSQGSSQSGKLIILNYKGDTSTDESCALVGKGVTFDTGGISLKPPAKMDEMKYDMCGSATVFAVLQAVVTMKLKTNLVVAMACAENMPSSNAGKPGDVVTSLSGKTIEILNTDAEGRLVLCDTLTYVQNNYKPNTIIDIATLTGACIVALGHHYAAMFANDSTLAQDLQQAADDSSDFIWQLPMNKVYHKQLDSPIADIANIGNVPAAQSAVAACFLEKFCEQVNWAHLDIAGVAWNSGSNKAATGRMVRLLLDYVISQENN